MTTIKIKDNDEYFKSIKGCVGCPFAIYYDGSDGYGYADCYCGLMAKEHNDYIGAVGPGLIGGDEEYEAHREKRLEHCPIVSIETE